MRSRTSKAISLLLVVIMGLALVAGACTDEDSSSSDKDSEAETAKGDEDQGSTTTKGDEGDESDQGDSQGDGSDPGASADFSEVVAKATTEVEGAKDACELYAAVGSLATVGNPETKDQTKEAADFYVVMLNKMAETSSDPEIANTLKTGAKEFDEYAKSVDYDPEKMNLAGTGPQMDSAEALDEAMNTYAETEFRDCTPPEGMAPEGSNSSG